MLIVCWLRFPLQVLNTEYIAPVPTKSSISSSPSFIVTRGSAGDKSPSSLLLRMTLDSVTASNPKQKTNQIQLAPFTAPAQNPKTISKATALMGERKPEDHKYWQWSFLIWHQKNEEQRPQLAAAGEHLLLCIKPRRHCQCLRPSCLMSPCWLYLVAWDVVQHRCWQAPPSILHSCVFGGTKLIGLSVIGHTGNSW